MNKRLEKLGLWTGGTVAGLIAVLAVAHVAVAEPPADATYKGMDTCVMCHKLTHKELTEAFLKSAHPKALLDASEEGAIVADFSGDCPLEKDMISMVLGVGKRQQSYIGKDNKTLPAKWDVAKKTWVPQEVVDAITQCVPCHVTDFKEDSKEWLQKGVTCESCHGPGSAHAASPKKELIGQMGELEPARQAMVCGQCHSRGVSVKDPTYKHPVGYKWGDDLTKYLKLDEVKGPALNQQYNEWLMSTHATSKVGCTTCHEVHGKGTANVAMLKKPQNALCMDCHAADVAAEGHPKVTDAIKCSMCHMPQGMHTFKMPGM